jgi:hypothetical protein
VYALFFQKPEKLTQKFRLKKRLTARKSNAATAFIKIRLKSDEPPHERLRIRFLTARRAPRLGIVTESAAYSAACKKHNGAYSGAVNKPHGFY